MREHEEETGIRLPEPGAWVYRNLVDLVTVEECLEIARQAGSRLRSQRHGRRPVSR